MDTRYQVFVSSTFEDLQEERQEVMHALLELDCMPSGMELFPAANDDQWTLIKKVIDDCDYYIVIIAGRYGSIGADGLGYTEMEYRYAIETRKPVIAFLHKDPEALPAKKTEKDQESRHKLSAFRKLAQEKMCKSWTSPAELGSVVSRSLIRLMKSSPATGWVRADQATDVNSTKEILRLRTRIEELESELEAIATRPPEGSEALAQGADTFAIRFTFLSHDPRKNAEIYGKSHATAVSTTWNDIFGDMAPLMIHEANDEQLIDHLNGFVRRNAWDDLASDSQFKGQSFSHFMTSDEDFQTIKVQLRSLGLIAKNDKPRSVKDTATYWALTPFGDTQMTKLRAIRRNKRNLDDQTAESMADVMRCGMVG